ncbi:hypothetical protein SAMN06298216_0965 [Spirosomataceae bacterium TFI 002]|nr:hypothetical protein SAMN06298216_0965 [Spirosomataceae bacterium TFI 002]
MKWIISLSLSLFSCFNLFAQETSSINPSLDIRTIINLKVLVINSVNLNFSFRNIDDYENGITKTGAFEVTVKSNQNWRLTIASSDPFLIPTSPGGTSDIPSGVFGLKKTSSSNFTTLSTTQKEVANGSRGGPNKSGNKFNLDLLCNPGYLYNGQAYMCEVIFTITAD